MSRTHVNGFETKALDPFERPPELRPTNSLGWGGRRGVPEELANAHGDRFKAGSTLVNAQGVIVLSMLLDGDHPETGECELQWHLSMSQQGKQPDRAAVRDVLRDFGVLGAAVEQKAEGVGRHFIVRCDAPRIAKLGEKPVEHVSFTDEHGIKWSNFAGPSFCDGCARAEKLSTSCALHRSFKT